PDFSKKSMQEEKRSSIATERQKISLDATYVMQATSCKLSMTHFSTTHRSKKTGFLGWYRT
ncbi:MAG: hypothetical protein OXE99_05625, partial [Cellvibrionales bacterium]|nr:hypothetical protein [Cellvibrionales bacterium]